MDEYTSSIFLNGLNTLVLHNTCEDSVRCRARLSAILRSFCFADLLAGWLAGWHAQLLAAPLIIDLCVLTELFTRIKVGVVCPLSGMQRV